jgi:hypothetical protein
MNRRRFVVMSTVLMVALTVAITGLAFYSNFVAKAFAPSVPNSIWRLPKDTQAVFGINVQRFVGSTVYAQIMQQHEQQIGSDLTEFIAKTGVDPRKDVDYIIGAARVGQIKGSGIVIAVGRFDSGTITNFINSKTTPIRVDLPGATVLMFPETNKLEKGIAFLSKEEIVLGDLDSIKAVLDVRSGTLGVLDNPTMKDLLTKVSDKEMFWFAGDATVLARIPTNTPMLPTLSAIQSVYGTLNLDNAINGKVSVTARDDKAAGQLADFARGIIALGNLAGGQNPDLAVLASGIQISQNASQFDISIALPFEMLQKLQNGKIVPAIK